MAIRYCSAVIVVEDVKKARRFYEGLLGQTVGLDHGECVGFACGFALWQRDHASKIMFGHEKALKRSKASHTGELYFETDSMEETYAAVLASGAKLVHDIREQPWGQRVFRAYDPDGYVVEIGEPMPVVILRFLKTGMTVEAAAARTSMLVEIVGAVAREAGLQ